MVLGSWGCSTEKDAFLNRAFHQTTARYNGYYHAKLAYNKGLRKLRQKSEENYEVILPVFVRSDEKTAKSIFPQMNRTIKKTSKVIDKHSMDIRGKQRNRWIDDNYLLLGKAHFYKNELEKAGKMFKYVSTKFKEQPIRYRAIMYLVRTNMKKGNMKRAGTLVQLLEDEKDKLPADRMDQYHEVHAAFNLEKEQYKEAARHLERAIELKSWIWDQKRRTRLTFILAQVYGQLGKVDRSNRYYAKVTNMNPSYEMEFYAKIKRALSYQASVRNSQGIKEDLRDMLKDPKNEEFFDQIHYALAQIELKEGDKGDAISHLRSSVQISRDNKEQKAKSSLLLADLLFKDQDYIPAQAYYDTASMFLSKEHPRIREVKTRGQSLKKLVKNLRTVEREDSLQRIASMEEVERRRFIRDQIQKARDRKEREQRQENRGNDFGNTGSSDDWQQRPSGKGKWYFYNEQLRSSGFNEFKKRFGDRPLQDNWRTKEKSNKVVSQGDESGGSESGEGDGKLRDMKDYLADLPLSDRAMRMSVEKEVGALYKAGLIYKEDLGDREKAERSFRKVLQESDTSHQYKAPTYYQLYRLNLDNTDSIGDQGEKGADHYKARILEEYPGSQYARLVRDPRAKKGSEKLREERRKLYEKGYMDYKKGALEGALKQCNAVLKDPEESRLRPKFYLLKGLIMGEMGEKDSMEALLDTVTTRFKGSPESSRAQAILDHLRKPDKKAPDMGPDTVKYKMEPEDKHFFVSIFPMTTGVLDKMKADVSDFNEQFFPSQDLEIKTTILGSDMNLLIVKDFKNKKKAMKYYRIFADNNKSLNASGGNDSQNFVIGSKNFSRLFEKKKVDGYTAFFEAKYLNGDSGED